jgi:HEAT repeat protein
MILVIGCWIVGAGLAQNPPAAPSAAVAPAASQGQAQELNRPAPQAEAPVAAAPTAAAESVQATVADNWNDFLHYTTIGRFDLAKGYGQAILQNKPNPADVFKLVRDNPQGYEIAMKVAETAQDQDLAQLTKQLLAVVEQGRFLQRTEPKIIVDEIRRLSSTPRGKMTAIQRLKDAGEYAVPFLLDAMGQVIQDPSRGPKLSDMIEALPQIGRPAIRPLVTALQTDNPRLAAEIIRALGSIGYPQSLAQLKYVAEKAQTPDLRALALTSIRKIDPQVVNTPAAALFYQLAERYYYHDQSLAPTSGAAFGNLWFWDAQANRLQRVEVNQACFHELMAMRCCEWSLRADEHFGPAIGLWLAAFFKAECTGVALPEYFGPSHAKALVYATTAGPEYLHQALARAVNDRNAAVALGAVEALATTAGEKSLMYTLGPAQPLLAALTFPDRAVRYSAAIAIANAGPRQPFTESRIVVQNLAEALAKNGQETPAPAGQAASGSSAEAWTPELADAYSARSVQAMLEVASSRNPVIDLSLAQPALIGATKDKRPEVRTLAGQVLVYLNSPDAQRAIATLAMDAANDANVRIAAFHSLIISAKLNGNLLPEAVVGDIYKLISVGQTDPILRAAAAAAYGALNLPSQKVKDLILDQAKG